MYVWRSTGGVSVGKTIYDEKRGVYVYVYGCRECLS